MSADASSVVSYVLTFFLIFGMTATCSFRNIIKQLKNVKALCIGLSLQFIFMPFFGFVAVKLFGRYLSSPQTNIILLVVTSSPGGSFSNWFCNAFNAELGLSVAMTTFSSIIGTFMLPANLLLYSYASFGSGATGLLQSLQWTSIFITLALVIIAVGAGLAAGYWFDNKTFRLVANKFGSLCGLGLIIMSFVTSSLQPGTQVWNRPWAFYCTVALPVVLGVLFSTLVVTVLNLKGPERMAVTIESTMQNITIGLSVAMGAFSNPTLRGLALGVPLFFGTTQFIVVSLYSISTWKLGWSKAPKDESICVIVPRTYEVEQDQTEEEENKDDEGNRRRVQLGGERTEADVSSTTSSQNDDSNIVTPVESPRHMLQSSPSLDV